MVHGIVETDDEDTDDLVIETISKKVNIEISPVDLDRMHKIGKKKVGQNKSRPIIVKLSRYNVRKKIFSNKKTLKRSNLSITESLASKRMEFIEKARSDGKILYKSSTENQVELYYEYH